MLRRWQDWPMMAGLRSPSGKRKCGWGEHEGCWQCPVPWSVSVPLVKVHHVCGGMEEEKVFSHPLRVSGRVWKLYWQRQITRRKAYKFIYYRLYRTLETSWGNEGLKKETWVLYARWDAEATAGEEWDRFRVWGSWGEGTEQGLFVPSLLGDLGQRWGCAFLWVLVGLSQEDLTACFREEG